MSDNAYRNKQADLGMRGLPTSAAIEVTHRCNARCAYCYLHFQKRIPDPPFELVCRMIDRLSGAGIISLLITGGEPFIRPDILDILDYAVRKDFYKISIYTNMTLMTDEHIAWLEKNAVHIEMVKCSVFSHLPSVNDEYFGVPGALEKIVAVMSALEKAGLFTRLTAVAVPENIEHFGETMRSFENQQMVVLSSAYKIIVNHEHYTLLEDSLSVEFFEKYFRSFSFDIIMSLKKKLLERIDVTTETGGMCLGCMAGIAVNPGGGISPCVAFRNVEIGSILDDKPLSEILRESKFRRELVSLRKHDIEGCRDCRYHSFCTVCPAANHNLHGDLYRLATSQYCNFIEALLRV